MAESPPGDGVDALPDDAEVCACAGVSAGRIRACSDLAEVRAHHPRDHRLRRLRRRRPQLCSTGRPRPCEHAFSPL